MAKYLDYDGLSKLWSKIGDHFVKKTGNKSESITGDKKFTGTTTIGGTNIYSAIAQVLGTRQNVTSFSGNKILFKNGATFEGTALDAGLCTRGICGTDTGGTSKSELYLNYDGNNNYSRKVVLGAGSTGESLGTGCGYTYCAIRGDEMKKYVTSLGYTKNTGTVTSVSVKINGVVKGTVTGSGTIDLGTYLTSHQSLSNYVTLNTNQTITGVKTFNAPASASGEQATATFKTANGGQIIFGKEGPNSGSMIALDQVAGTRRLNFRASATPGAIVWSQPESNSSLYYDVTNVYFRGCTSVSFNSASTITFNKFTSASALGTDANGNLKKVSLAKVATSGSYNDLNNKPNLDAKADNHRHFKSDDSGRNSGVYTYYKLASFPADNAGNSCSLTVDGRIGGWNKGNKGYLSMIISNRDGISATGTLIGNAQLKDLCDLVVYTSGTTSANSTATLYVKTYSWFAFDLTLGAMSGANDVYDGKGVKTTPAGTLAWELSKNINNFLQVRDDGDVWKKGKSVALVSQIPDISGKADKSSLSKVATSGSYNDLLNKPTNLVTTDTEQTVTGTKHFNAITANTIGTGSDANNYFQSQKFRGEGDANTYYHAVDFGYAGHNQVDFYEYGGNYNFYINTQANTDSRQLLFGINPSGIKIPPAAGAKVLGTNAEGQVESHSLGIADISSLQSTLDGKVNSSSLATVARTGSYNDLSNKPNAVTYSNSGSNYYLWSFGGRYKISAPGSLQGDGTYKDVTIITSENLSSQGLFVPMVGTGSTPMSGDIQIKGEYEGTNASSGPISGGSGQTHTSPRNTDLSLGLKGISYHYYGNDKTYGSSGNYTYGLCYKAMETAGGSYSKLDYLLDAGLTVFWYGGSSNTNPSLSNITSTTMTYDGKLTLREGTSTTIKSIKNLMEKMEISGIDGTGYATYGYVKDDATGLMICYGTTGSRNGAGVSVTFSATFKGAPTVVVVPYVKSLKETSIVSQYRNAITIRCYINSNNSNVDSTSGSTSITGFVLDTGNGEYQYFNYIAIGQYK